MFMYSLYGIKSCRVARIWILPHWEEWNTDVGRHLGVAVCAEGVRRPERDRALSTATHSRRERHPAMLVFSNLLLSLYKPPRVPVTLCPQLSDSVKQPYKTHSFPKFTQAWQVHCLPFIMIPFIKMLLIFYLPQDVRTSN